MNTEKQKLRQWAKEQRNMLDNTAVSSKLTDLIIEWQVFKSAENIMLYYPIATEYNLLSLMNNTDKTFLFPAIIDDSIFPVKYSAELGFKQGAFGINEPIGKPLDINFKIDLVIVPALVVDKYGCRLGYGKGFYDRFLSDNKCLTTCAVVHSSLFVDKLPAEPHDFSVDFVITEREIIKSTQFI